MQQGMAAGGSPAVQPAGRPRHRLTRSITETPPKSKSHVPVPSNANLHGGHHGHHHLHLHRHRGEHRGDRLEPQASQPNLQPSSSGVAERRPSDIHTPDGSRAGSRRASSVMDISPITGLLNERRPVKEGEVQAEQQKAALQAAELNNTVLDLNKLSHNTTQRLDSTYYSVLEKLEQLTSTISLLKELSAASRALTADFKTESEEIVSENTGQLETLEQGFVEKEQRIDSLVARITNSHTRVHGLGERVEVVKAKVETWEAAEEEWQEQTRKRLRILWGVIAVVILVSVGLLIFEYAPASKVREVHVSAKNMSSAISQIETDISEMGANSRKSAEEALEILRGPAEELAEEPRLRPFDEL